MSGASQVGQSEIASLLARTDLAELVGVSRGWFKVASRRRGGELHGPCPFCGGDDRFWVLPQAEPAHWACRQCAPKGGDAVDFVRTRDNCSFPEAIRTLQSLAGDEPLPRAGGPEAEGPPTAAWQAHAEAFTEWCAQQLWGEAGAAVRGYLAGRGLTEATIRRARLGLCPDMLWRERADWGLAPETRANGQPKRLWLPRGLVIPVTVDGMPWGMRIRRPVEGDALAAVMGAPFGSADGKYVYVAGSRPALFGADTLPGRPVVVLCEGELDALLLQQEAGDLVGVATLGSASARLRGASLWALRHARHVLLAYDTDAAGQAGAGALESLSARMRRVSVPAKDLTALHQAGGSVRAWALHQIRQLEAPPVTPALPSTWGQVDADTPAMQRAAAIFGGLAGADPAVTLGPAVPGAAQVPPVGAIVGAPATVVTRHTVPPIGAIAGGSAISVQRAPEHVAGPVCRCCLCRPAASGDAVCGSCAHRLGLAEAHERAHGRPWPSPAYIAVVGARAAAVPVTA
ncbi:MAG: toprim domain-containing protein [Chloroflexota bacterium]|nr:toprim domain-containing protein [Chloroflexota bacterium]